MQGIWEGGVEDVTCTALNHKYRLLAFGRSNNQGVVYSIVKSKGGLEMSHQLILLVPKQLLKPSSPLIEQNIAFIVTIPPHICNIQEI